MSLPALNLDETQPAKIEKPAKLHRWIPKKWEPVYEEIVVLSCLGKSNVSLAEKYGYTKEHVSNILNTPQALVIKRQVLEHLQKESELTIPQRLAAIADKAVVRIAQAMDDDEIYANHPLAVVDRALTVLKGVGKLAGDGSTTNKVHITMSTESALALRQSIEAANKAKQLNAGMEEIVIEAKDVESSKR